MHNDELSGENKANAIKALADMKKYVITSFQKLDKNGDGFLSRSELQEALAAPGLTARDAASLNFLLVRLGEIGRGDETDKRISREDLNNYFAAILPDQP